MKPVLLDTDILSMFFRNNRDVYASLRKKGKLIDDIDILIAGIALANNLVFVTNNEDHFKRIDGLEIMNWGKEEENVTENVE